MAMIDGPIIYKRDTNGKIRIWHYCVNPETGAWKTYSAIKDGATVVSGWTTCTPKSQATAADQALFEARAEMGKKLDRDYVLRIEDVDVVRSFGADVMLAQVYNPKKVVAGERRYSQPKLDGIRCKANRFGLWTRKGKPHLAAPHIAAALANFFKINPTIELDGEFYNHDLRDNFNEISSIVRKSKPTEEDTAKSAEMVQYHLYDIVGGMTSPFGERSLALLPIVRSLNNPSLVYVKTEAVESVAEIDAAYDRYMDDGYEGQIIRLNQPYENKRSKTLLKRKDFIDEEFEILGIEEGNGNWAGYAKRLKFKLKDGRSCGAGIAGDQAFTKTILDARKELLGRLVTVRYFKPTPDGMPRFPVAVDFHGAEGRVD